MEPTYISVDGERVPIYWKTPYNHDTNAEAKRTELICTDESRAQQHLANEVDINTIVGRFLKTGTMPQIPMPPRYEDWDDAFDFQSSMNLIAAGKASFAALPAEVRDAFHNDPARFINTIDHWSQEPDQAKREKNLETMRALNLAVPPGPKADDTTLGDVLRAIKEQGTPRELPAPKP
nr:MAG: internal scaffolding protein [Microvirus sp.]